MSENKKEMLLREFSDILSNTDYPLGNAVYKNAKENNPSIKHDSPLDEKIESLPDEKRDELFLTLDDMLQDRYFKMVENAVGIKFANMGVM